DVDGVAVLHRLRGHFSGVPGLFLTAKDAVEDRVAGLTPGGGDYVTKPFSLQGGIARLPALLRRSGMAASAREDAMLVVGDLVMDEDSHEVRRGDDPINLTATEFELLRYLMRNPRRVLSKAQILDRVWNYDFGGQANVVELYISYLRKKIDAGREPMIHTMRGAGYVLKPVDWRHDGADVPSRAGTAGVVVAATIAQCPPAHRDGRAGGDHDGARRHNHDAAVARVPPRPARRPAGSHDRRGRPGS